MRCWVGELGGQWDELTEITIRTDRLTVSGGGWVAGSGGVDEMRCRPG